MAQDIFAEIDTTELLRAMKLYEDVTKKDGADIVNRAARNACLGGRGLKGALQLTKRAKLGDINKFDPEKIGKSKVTKKRARLHYANASKAGHRKGSGIGKEAKRRHSKRRSAAGYSKAIWIAIGRDFGAKLRSKFTISGPNGKKATQFSLKATIDTGRLDEDHVRDVMADALQQGVRNAAVDMREFAASKMEERAKEFSGR